MVHGTYAGNTALRTLRSRIVVGLLFRVAQVLVFTAYGVQRDNIGDRMAINLTLVLTAVAFKYVVKEEIPNVPYLTILDKYILIGFFMMCVQVSFSV